uniref:Uncharacterized protein n=1 Tax=Setaria viridis TaxID=4556 RepID=A0A4U6UYA7_SETVI|nr:hypothetical protein SEVIR_4G081300v2 [Setaria viridis]
MGSSYMSLSRKRVTLPTPLISLPAPTTNRWVEFHEVELEHIFWRWDVSAMVFWKHTRGTKMGVVACGNHHMMFNNVLIEGETYDFLGVYFTPTYMDPIPNMYYLCEYNAVVLLPNIVIKTPQRPIWISECPHAFREFEDVYHQPVDTFVQDVIGVVVYASEIQDRGKTSS